MGMLFKLAYNVFVMECIFSAFTLLDFLLLSFTKLGPHLNIAAVSQTLFPHGCY